MKRVVVTGPLARLAEYAQAARAAGWEAIEAPLLRIEPRRFHRSDLREERYDWICVTSASALPWLGAAIGACANLRATPCAVVGERTAERVRALGLALGLEPAPDAASLGAGLRAREHLRAHAGVRAHAGGASRVLWPRGNLSDELARSLREDGLAVEDPVAYATHALSSEEPIPPSAAVLFASPSAVRAWHERPAGSDPRIAIAIGRTTLDALLQETPARFFDTISLPQATPEAFGVVLAHLDPETSS